MAAPNLPLNGTFSATCPACHGNVDVQLEAVHTGTDYTSGEPVNKVTVQGSYTHTCPETETKPES